MVLIVSGRGSIAQEFARIERIPERMNSKSVRKNTYSVKVTVITTIKSVSPRVYEPEYATPLKTVVGILSSLRHNRMLLYKLWFQ